MFATLQSVRTCGLVPFLKHFTKLQSGTKIPSNQIMTSSRNTLGTWRPIAVMDYKLSKSALRRTPHLVLFRPFSLFSKADFSGYSKATVVNYLFALVIAMVGSSFLSVPLYRKFCQAYGIGGQLARQEQQAEKLAKMGKTESIRNLTVKLSGDVWGQMKWKFEPSQPAVNLKIGETALIFYKATNPTDKPISGVSTYSVLPYEAGLYFNKIQCFCFEEQRLNPHETVDMPVFFYIDEDFEYDPELKDTDDILLHYTFFESQDYSGPPLPGYSNTQNKNMEYIKK